MKITEKQMKIIYVCLIAVMSITLLIMVILEAGRDNEIELPEAAHVISSDKTVIIPEVKNEPEITVTTEILAEDIRNMGILETESYYFTQLEEYESSKELFLGISADSRFVYSYDGVVTAGIDFSKVEVELDHNIKQCKIKLPDASIQHVEIDNNSFKKYSEKESIWNKLSIADYNTSVVIFKDKAKVRALQQGILDKANENAERLVRNLVGSLIDTSEYKVIFE